MTKEQEIQEIQEILKKQGLNARERRRYIRGLGSKFNR